MYSFIAEKKTEYIFYFDNGCRRGQNASSGPSTSRGYGGNASANSSPSRNESDGHLRRQLGRLNSSFGSSGQSRGSGCVVGFNGGKFPDVTKLKQNELPEALETISKMVCTKTSKLRGILPQVDFLLFRSRTSTKQRSTW